MTDSARVWWHQRHRIGLTLLQGVAVSLCVTDKWLTEHKIQKYIPEWRNGSRT